MLPELLQKTITTALESVQKNEKHDLLPLYRRNIYQVMNSDNFGVQRLVTLSSFSVLKVIDIWDQERPKDDRPLQLIKLAEDAATGRVSRHQAEQQALAAWHWSTNEYLDRLEPVSDAACFVLDAAVRTVMIALGYNTYDSVALDEQVTDYDLDAYTRDAAVNAVMAVAGPIWKADSDSGERLKFWLWWLQDANPSAWSVGQH